MVLLRLTLCLSKSTLRASERSPKGLSDKGRETLSSRTFVASGRFWDVSPGLAERQPGCVVPGTGSRRVDMLKPQYFRAWPLSGLASASPSGARSVTVTSIVSGDVLAIGGGACDDLVERPSRGFFETAILLAVR